jgi:hypothetical protein
MPWKEINLDELLEKTEASKQLQNSDIGVSNPEFSDQKISKKLHNPLHHSKWQRKQVALRNTFFYGHK